VGTIFISREGKQPDQFTEAEVSEGLRAGRFLPGDLAWKEGMETWKPLSTFAEFASLPPAAAVPVPMSPGKINFQECFAKGWECYKANFGISVAAALIIFAISFLVQIPMSVAQIAAEAAGKDSDLGALVIVGWAIYVFFSVVSSAVLMIMTAGFIYFLIAALRSGEANIRLVFIGFRSPYWSRILLAGAIWWLVAIAAVIVFVLPGVIITILTHSEIAAIISPALCVFPLVYLTVAAGYSFPLIIDRELGAMESLRLSCKTVHRQWFPAFGLLIIIGLIMAAGILACCVGVIFAAPLAYLIWAQAYRQLFGDR
jgi:hypothetical protein